MRWHLPFHVPVLLPSNWRFQALACKLPARQGSGCGRGCGRHSPALWLYPVISEVNISSRAFLISINLLSFSHFSYFCQMHGDNILLRQGVMQAASCLLVMGGGTSWVIFLLIGIKPPAHLKPNCFLTVAFAIHVKSPPSKYNFL